MTSKAEELAWQISHVVDTKGLLRDIIPLIEAYGRDVREAAAREIADKGQYNVVGLARIIREMPLP